MRGNWDDPRGEDGKRVIVALVASKAGRRVREARKEWQDGKRGRAECPPCWIRLFILWRGRAFPFPALLGRARRVFGEERDDVGFPEVLEEEYRVGGLLTCAPRNCERDRSAGEVMQPGCGQWCRMLAPGVTASSCETRDSHSSPREEGLEIVQ